MHYDLSAMVSTPQVLEPISAQHRCARVVPLHTANLALIPVTEDLVLDLDGKSIRVSPETGFWKLSIGLQRLLATASARGPIAYLEADYFGREGRQTAAVWNSGVTIYGPGSSVGTSRFRLEATAQSAAPCGNSEWWRSDTATSSSSPD
jgi:hypothetical protein